MRKYAVVALAFTSISAHAFTDEQCVSISDDAAYIARARDGGAPMASLLNQYDTSAAWSDKSRKQRAVAINAIYTSPAFLDKTPNEVRAIVIGNCRAQK
ncbi:hypothetical protein [Paraburkholderia flava]|uniref:hypothetical protein n=1 Tax=Paraburkholderia flava TaxID=2547393 RepID=UPI00105D073E|nr:hypothetical protein [Paraburkholderia flava]